jgi:hypothetical protein
MKLVLKLLIYNATGLNDCDDAGRENGRSLVSGGGADIRGEMMLGCEQP